MALAAEARLAEGQMRRCWRGNETKWYPWGFNCTHEGDHFPKWHDKML